MELFLTRPLVVFDLETTGVRVGADRIVQISMVKVMPDQSESVRTYLINPEIPIPPEVIMIHGITDEDVANKPTFKQIAGEIKAFIGNSDLAGFNSNKFDIPLLVEEFYRCGYEFELKNRHLVDVQNIFHKMEQRTLKAAYKFYCNKELLNAHDAEADTKATLEILKAQIKRYEGAIYTDQAGNESTPVVNKVGELAKFSTKGRIADLVGHIAINEKEEEVFNFGKHKGKGVEQVFNSIDPSYYDWMMKGDFPHSTKKVITEIKLRGMNKMR